MSLPIQMTSDKNLLLLQTTWASQLNPLLAAALLNGQVVKLVNLGVGTTQINHGLQRKLQGYFIVRQRGPANIYDTQDSNPNPTLTLALVSSAAVSVDIYVF